MKIVLETYLGEIGTKLQTGPWHGSLCKFKNGTGGNVCLLVVQHDESWDFSVYAVEGSISKYKNKIAKEAIPDSLADSKTLYYYFKGLDENFFALGEAGLESFDQGYFEGIECPVEWEKRHKEVVEAICRNLPSHTSGDISFKPAPFNQGLKRVYVMAVCDKGSDLSQIPQGIDKWDLFDYTTPQSDDYYDRIKGSRGQRSLFVECKESGFQVSSERGKALELLRKEQLFPYVVICITYTDKIQEHPSNDEGFDFVFSAEKLAEIYDYYDYRHLNGLIPHLAKEGQIEKDRDAVAMYPKVKYPL
jgi:hypothetical protein